MFPTKRIFRRTRSVRSGFFEISKGELGSVAFRFSLEK